MQLIEQPPPVRRTPSGNAYDEAMVDDAPSADIFEALPEVLHDEEEDDPPEEPPSPAIRAVAQGLGTALLPPAAALPAAPPPATSREEQRAVVAARLQVAYAERGHRFLSHKEALFMHGGAYDGPMKPPTITWKSDKPPRRDHDAPPWLTATEFADQPQVMDAKVGQLAKLMRLSTRTVVYTGAGISASAVGQAALSGTNKVGWTGAGTSALPTITHHALGVLGRTGWVHGWVQQNHDGLPQKAGFPQELICEVHGSWFDPSNPVVKYSGSLKDHECAWMERETEAADLVLVLGTSLGGLFADQVATECCERAAAGASLGACIINLQQTDQDGKMTLNIFGKSDEVMQLLLAELGLPPLEPTRLGQVAWPEAVCALVPYDAAGRRLPAGSGKPRMWLDLRPGAKVKLSAGHNHQNAKQPNTMHIGAKKGQQFHGKELQHVGPGLGAVVRRDEASASFKLNIESAPMKLGIWWLEAAARGGPEMLPLVNQRPVFEDSPDPSGGDTPKSTGKAPKTNGRVPSPKGGGRAASPKGSGGAASPKGGATRGGAARGGARAATPSAGKRRA